jgi:hypothetical protein
MSIMSGWQFQLNNTTCITSIIVPTLNVRQCQMACLTQAQCRAATFDRSNSTCQLFFGTPNLNNNMSSNTDAVSIIVISGTRTPVVGMPQYQYGIGVLGIGEYWYY